MSTSRPTLSELDDYLHDGLPASDVDGFEERLFDAAQHGESDAVEFLHQLQKSVSWLAKEHQFGEGHTRAFVDALLAKDQTVHYLAIEPRGAVEIPMWKDGTTRVVIHTQLDVRGYEQVQVVAGLEGGEPLITFRDVACDPNDGHLYAVCFEPLAKMAFSVGRLCWRITGQRAGQRETLAEATTQLVAAAP